MGDRVAVLTPEGQFGTVDAADVENLPEGARVLTRAQEKAQELDEAYAQKSLGEKATSLASIAGPLPFAARAAYKVATGHGDEVAPTLPPELEAYAQGVSQGFAGGVPTLAMKELVRLTGGDTAAKAYGQTAEDVREAHDTLHGAGFGAGLIGGAVAGGPKAGLGAAKYAIPSAALTAGGEALEQAAARGITGLVGDGVIGRAASTGASMALRGAAEGAVMNAAQYTSDALIGDHEMAGEKLWAATGSGALGGALIGGGLGTAGSLFASGARAGAGAVGGAAMRALAKGEEAATAGKQLAADVGAKAEVAAQEAKALGAEVVDAAKAKAAGVAGEATGTVGKAVDAVNEGVQKAASSDVTASVLDAIRGKATDENVMKVAYERAFRATGGRKAFVAEAEKYLPNGVQDVGEVLLRRGVIDANGKLADVLAQGTPAALAERIQAPLAAVGQRLGEIVDNSGARIAARDLDSAFADVVQPLLKSAATEPAGRAVLDYTKRLGRTLGIESMDSTVAVQDLLRERKALDRLVFENASLDPALTTQLKREIRAKMEGLIERGIDEASGKVAGDALAEYKGLKRDYQALRIAQDAAEDAAVRGVANRSHSLTDKIIGSTVGGAASVIGGPVAGLVAGPAAAMVSKFVRERGDAATAILLKRAADMGLVSKAMQHVDDAVARASTGILSIPKPRPMPEGSASKGVPIMQRAQQVIARVAAAQADPVAHVNMMLRNVEPLTDTAPGVASAYVMSASRAAAFMASKLPVTAQPDPLAPGQKPSLTPEDAHRLVRYAEYVDRPMKFFDDLQHGKLTPEGAEVAQALMPRAFAQLQANTANALVAAQVRGVRIPEIQKTKIGILLGFPATPAQRPEMIAMMQQNVQSLHGPGNMPSAAPAPPQRPASVSTQQSPLDRLEAH